jgi:single-strand DNA-binding protein
MMLPTITVIGNLKRIETKFLDSGKQVTRFQVECADKDKNGNYTNLYLSGEVWEKSAEFVNNYFQEGSHAIVTGELYTNVYEKDGRKVYENKLRFPKVSFVPKDRSIADNQQPQNNQSNSHDNHNVNNSQPQQQPQQTIPDYDIDEDEIPF